MAAWSSCLAPAANGSNGFGDFGIYILVHKTRRPTASSQQTQHRRIDIGIFFLLKLFFFFFGYFSLTQKRKDVHPHCYGVFGTHSRKRNGERQTQSIFLIHLHKLTTVFREEQKRCLFFLWEPDWEKRERGSERRTAEGEDCSIPFFVLTF